ncbi:MAG: STAS domain-containing protein [Spirochaetes bacterium]|nr:STAS domain-containing protein [Spirochaetota bacterium]
MATLQYSVTRSGNISFISIGGSLDAKTSPMLNSKFEEELKKSPNIIIINMKNLDYIASAGLGILISLNEKMNSRKKDLRLCEASEKVRKIFKALGFDTLFSFYKTEKDASK